MRDVRLLVSELVTNAVRHANLDDGDVIGLVVELADDALRVEVHDPGGGFVPTAPVAGPRAALGLGPVPGRRACRPLGRRLRRPHAGLVRARPPAAAA